MQILKQEKQKVILGEELGDEKIQYTLLNMGDFVGYRSREWYQDAPSFWKAMFIETNNEKEQRILKYESLVDAGGKLMRVIISDLNNNSRRVKWYKTSPYSPESDCVIYEEEGQSKFDIGRVYDFDPTTQSFVSENGEIAPESALTDVNLVEKFNALAERAKIV